MRSHKRIGFGEKVAATTGPQDCKPANQLLLDKKGQNEMSASGKLLEGFISYYSVRHISYCS